VLFNLIAEEDLRLNLIKRKDHFGFSDTQIIKELKLTFLVPETIPVESVVEILKSYEGLSTRYENAQKLFSPDDLSHMTINYPKQIYYVKW